MKAMSHKFFDLRWGPILIWQVSSFYTWSSDADTHERFHDVAKTQPRIWRCAFIVDWPHLHVSNWISWILIDFNYSKNAWRCIKLNWRKNFKSNLEILIYTPSLTNGLENSKFYHTFQSVKEYFSPTLGGGGFFLQVWFRTPKMIGPRTMTLIAGSLQYLWNQSNQVKEDMIHLHGALCLIGVKETCST
jgi:hypothetical protein